MTITQATIRVNGKPLPPKTIVEIFTTPDDVLEILKAQGDYPEICVTFKTREG